MRTSHSGRAFLAREEAVILVGYKDSVGVATIGVGHTKSAGAPTPVVGQKITLKDAMDIFARDLRSFEQRVNTLVQVPMSQAMFDALLIFDFNTGGLRYRSKKSGKIVNSSLLNAINGKKGLKAIEAGFMAWSRAGTNPVLLKPRRQREFALFSKGQYGSINTVPVSTVWPPKYKQTPLPEDSEEVEAILPTPRPIPEENVQQPGTVTEQVEDADIDADLNQYDPEQHGPAVNEPPKPMSQSKTLWSVVSTWLGTAGAAFATLFSNPNTGVVIAVIICLTVVALAGGVIFRERIRKFAEGI